MYPEFHSQELEARVDYFILNASPDELFRMQKGLFDLIAPFLMEDERAAALMRAFDRKRLGLIIGNDYESTLLFKEGAFEVLWGTRRGYPVFEVTSREAYRDAILHRVDMVRLIMLRRIRVRHLGLLARWALPCWYILVDSSLFEKLLGYQDRVEKWIDEALSGLGY